MPEDRRPRVGDLITPKSDHEDATQATAAPAATGPTPPQPVDSLPIVNTRASVQFVEGQPEDKPPKHVTIDVTAIGNRSTYTRQEYVELEARYIVAKAALRHAIGDYNNVKNLYDRAYRRLQACTCGQKPGSDTQQIPVTVRYE